MSASPWLLAAADTWLQIAIVVIGAVIYLFNHLIAANKTPPRRPPRPDLRPEQRPPRPNAPRPGGRGETQDEVAEFLKRAAQRRSAGKPGPEPRNEPPRRLTPVDIVEAQSVEPPASGRLTASMQPHVDNRELRQRAGHLTNADRAEAAFQAHMQIFEHSVGRIHEAGTGAASDTEQPVAATPHEIFAALLADPQSLRQAIILNEIIQRPVERW